ncbi:DNA-directed RNA polymerase specialized sigma24 family protein [Streptacidiphilus sp. MAP12-33]|uniref:RNA polymerase sigma factor n=1 Tax=Streptacidiphilus sp. MAP12-33 TaxID=3156266 RepID=UPI00351706C5
MTPPGHTERPPEPGGDREQFGAFYRAHFDAVLGFVARRVDGPHTAADLTADVFLATWEHRAGYDPRRGVPLAWLYGIARRVVAGNTRSSAREFRAVSRISGRRLLDDADIAALEERLDAERAARDLLAHHAALSEPLRPVDLDRMGRVMAGRGADGATLIRPSAIPRGDTLLLVWEPSRPHTQSVALRLVHHVPDCAPAA